MAKARLSFPKHLSNATGSSYPSIVDINGAWLNVDRGFINVEFLNYTTSINLNVFFTKKKGSDVPWKLRKVGYKGQEKQVELSEKGCQHVWEATKKINSKKKIQLIAHLNGSGRVILHVSASPIHSADNWIIVPKSPVNRSAYLNSHVKKMIFHQNGKAMFAVPIE